MTVVAAAALSSTTTSSLAEGMSTASVADSSVADSCSYMSSQQQEQQEEDSIHQRASLVLQMANSVVSSNNRRKQQLKQIECGRADTHISTLIDDIMNEKPANILDLLKEGEPTSATKKAKGGGTASSSAASSSSSSKEGEEKENDDDEYSASCDNNSAVTGVDDDDDDDPEHRYEALLKKYLALKQLQQKNPNSFARGGESNNNNNNSNVVMPRSSITGSVEDQLKQAYQALVRLKENSELRYSVLESRYLNMKRNLAETTERNNRLEQDLEAMRLQLLRVMNNSNGNNSGDGNSSNILMMDESTSILSTATPSRRASFSGVGSVGTLSTLKLEGMSNRIKQLQNEKKQANKQQRLFLQEFHVLCDKVEDCETCQPHICQATLTKVKAQLAKLMDTSSRHGGGYGESSEEEEKQMDSDLDVDSIAQSHRSEEEDNLESSMKSSSHRHNDAMAVLGANWDKLAKIDETKLDKREKKRRSRLEKMKKKPHSKFANLSEPKSEQKLRGKKSQFVAAQSGVYCRIDHTMERKKDGSDQLLADAPIPPTPPKTPTNNSSLDTLPSLQGGPSSSAMIKQQQQLPGSPTDVTKFVHAPSGDYKLVTPAEPAASSSSSDVPNKSPQPTMTTQPDPSSPASSTTGNSALTNKTPTTTNSSSLPQINESLPLSSDKRSNSMVPGGSARVPGGSARVRKSTTGVQQSPTTTNMAGVAEEGRQNLTPDKPAMEKRVELPQPTPPIKSATNQQAAASGQIMETDNGSGKSPPRGGGLDESERSGRKSNRSGGSVTSFHTAAEDSLQQRVKAIPPAKLSPEERKAKREAALREAKATVRSVRKGNFGAIRKNKNAALGADDDASEISGISNVSSVHDLNGEIKNSLRKFKGILENGKDGQPTKGGKGLFKNPFKRRNTTVDLTSDPVIPTEIVEDLPLALSSSSAGRRHSTPHNDRNSPSRRRRHRHDDDDDDDEEEEEEEEEEVEAPAVTRRYSTTDIVAKRIQEMSNNAHVQAQREKIAKGRSNRKAKASLAAAVEAQQLSLKHLDVKPPVRKQYKPKPFLTVGTVGGSEF